MYPETYKKQQHVLNSNYESIIRESDVILLIHSEATLSKFGNGFIEMVYDMYFDPSKKTREINAMKQKIRSTPEWYKLIVEKARTRQISADSMLTLDAIYAIEMDR